MPQSGVIVAALMGGFVLWLALNNKLLAYWTILVGGAPGSGGTSAAGPQVGSSATGPSSGLGSGTQVGASAANYTPVTTPQPGSSPTPLGSGGIGSA